MWLQRNPLVYATFTIPPADSGSHDDLPTGHRRAGVHRLLEDGRIAFDVEETIIRICPLEAFNVRGLSDVFGP
jgi:hypothetical protein